MRNALPPFGPLGSPVSGCEYFSLLIYLRLVLPKPIQDKHKDLLTSRADISLWEGEYPFESALCYLPWFLLDSVFEVEKTQGSAFLCRFLLDPILLEALYDESVVRLRTV